MGLLTEASTIFCMLLIVWEVVFMYVKVKGFVRRRLVGEAEFMDSWLANHKLELFSCLVPEILNMITRRPRYLKNLHINEKFQRGDKMRMVNSQQACTNIQKIFGYRNKYKCYLVSCHSMYIQLLELIIHETSNVRVYIWDYSK